MVLLLFLHAFFPGLRIFTDAGHEGVGGPDFGGPDPLPDDEQAVVDLAVDEDGVADGPLTMARRNLPLFDALMAARR